MKSIRLILLGFLFLPAISFGQGPPPPEDMPMRAKIRERLQTIKIWRLTEEVGLTSEQSEKFFPLYNQHQKAIDELEFKRGEILNRLEEMTEDDKTEDGLISGAIRELEENSQRMTQERNRFIDQISSVLDTRQKARWLVFEDRFRQRIQEIIQDIRREFRGGREMEKRP
jgi:hypothetical protein